MRYGKDLLKSKTFWAALVGLVAVLLTQFGITIDQTHVVNDIVALISFAGVLYGRFTADKPITTAGGVRLGKRAP